MFINFTYFLGSYQYNSYPVPAFPTPIAYPAGRFNVQTSYVPPPPPPSPLPQFKPIDYSRKPFYINVNPVYPTGEKFTPFSFNKVPITEKPVIVNVPISPVVTTEAEAATTQIPLKQATEEPTPDSTIPPSFATEKIVDEKLFFTEAPATSVPVIVTETVTEAVTPVISETRDESEPSIRFSSAEPSPPLPVIVPTLPPTYRQVQSFVQQVPQPVYPYQGIILNQEKKYEAPIVPSFLNTKTPIVPSFYNSVPPQTPTIQIPAACPCYVMTKDANGTTATTTQSPIQTVNNPPTGILVLLYPLCPGDSINQVQQVQPALSSAFIIPYPCGQCDANRNVAIPQFKSFQEAVAQGTDFRSPTLILNSPQVPEKQVRYRVAKKKIVSKE